MITTVDIGNTNIMLCSFCNNKIIRSKKVPILNLKKNNIHNILKSFIKKKNNGKVIISSVVPTLDQTFSEFLKSLNCDYYFVKDLSRYIGLKTNIKKKKEIGDDRIINMFFAKQKYDHSIIVIDFGTATTFDVLNHDGIYDGGVITPGIELSLFALKANTAKLPLVKFKKTNKVIGMDTKEAIQSGFFWGYVSMIEGLINLIQAEKNKKMQVILTGGNSNFFKKIIKNVLLVDEYFTSKGLNCLIRKADV